MYRTKRNTVPHTVIYYQAFRPAAVKAVALKEADGSFRS